MTMLERLAVDTYAAALYESAARSQMETTGLTWPRWDALTQDQRDGYRQLVGVILRETE